MQRLLTGPVDLRTWIVLLIASRTPAGWKVLPWRMRLLLTAAVAVLIISSGPRVPRARATHQGPWSALAAVPSWAS